MDPRCVTDEEVGGLENSIACLTRYLGRGRSDGVRRRRRQFSVMLAATCALAVSMAAAQAPDPDLNDDGIVNIYDVSLVSSCFGQDPLTVPRCRIADTDGDGDVDMDDINYRFSEN